MFSSGFHDIWLRFQLRLGFRENLDQNSNQISSFHRIFTGKFTHKKLHTESRCIERIDTRKIIKIGSLRVKIWWVEKNIFFEIFWKIWCGFLHFLENPRKICTTKKSMLKYRYWTYTLSKNYQNPSRELRERVSNAPFFFWSKKKPSEALNGFAL